MTGSAQEQEVPGEAQEARRTLVMALPGTPVSSIWGLVGQLGAGVEHAVSPHVALVGSVQVSGSLQGTDSLYTGGSGSSGQTWGVGVDPGVHFYLTGRAPEGFWVGPHLELGTYHWTTRTEYLTGLGSSGEVALVTVDSRSRTVQYGGSVRVGYTAILAPGLTFQVGAGLSALSSLNTIFGEPSTVSSSMNNIRNWSLSPRMTLGVGWAF
ncbi:hypothetical protein BO221_26275 [Archangium sp. Cb G35]|nr:hypothetical protein BO221_26275 [Archangium sp. Cb G35]